MVQKAKKLKNNFFRPYANAGNILFIPTMLVKKLEANFYRANNTKCQYFGISFVPWNKKQKSFKNNFFEHMRMQN